MRTISAIVAIVVAGLAAPSEACRCAPGPPEPAESLRAADLVFLGVAAEVANDGPDDPAERKYWEFEVEGAWKGPAERRLRIYAWGADGWRGNCSYTFELGETYLVYSHQEPGYPTRFRTTICSRTAKKADAESDLATLGPPRERFYP